MPAKFLNLYKNEFSELLWDLAECYPKISDELRTQAVELIKIFKNCNHQLGGIDGDKLVELAWETSFRDVDYFDTYHSALKIIEELLT